ncbi:MAG: helix-turn-helix domain-containing protein [Nocardioidaceae bacterium]
MADVTPIRRHHDEPWREPLLRNVIGDVLRRERTAQRRTLRDVADDAGVSVPYLSEIERGRKEASSEVLAAICRSLRLPLSDVVGAAHHDLTGTRVTTTQRPGDVLALAA